jgi:hypothetical protein
VVVSDCSREAGHVLSGLHCEELKTTYTPQGEKMSKLVHDKERARKDVERVFGVLQTYWAIVWHPSRTWIVETM